MAIPRLSAQRKTGKGLRIPLKFIFLAACLLLFFQTVLMPAFFGSNSENIELPKSYTKSDKTSSDSFKKWDSQKSAVLGLATGYMLRDYKRFVGSLRATGFPGHIILGIAANAPSDVVQYLAESNVETHVVEMAEKCTYDGSEGENGEPITSWKCLKDYPDWKITWGRFGLYKDWLRDCPDCTDGIILTDVRDAYFQRDPFQAVTPEQQKPLMVFEEIDLIDTTHWLVDFPVRSCKGEPVGSKPMLCSGSIMGSREGILDYIEVATEEFDDWKTKPKCRTGLIGDDQSIHNYLYYSNRLKNVIAIPHRTGPIHVVGYQAARIFEEAQDAAKAKSNNTNSQPSRNFYVEDDMWQKWLPEKYGLLEEKTGMIVNLDGSPSSQVHQYDRFGPLIDGWFEVMDKKDWSYNSGK